VTFAVLPILTGEITQKFTRDPRGTRYEVTRGVPYQTLIEKWLAERLR
jgi:hypothetical protein